MKNVKYQAISIIIISTLILALWVTAGFTSNNAAVKPNKLFVTSSQGREISPEFVKKSMSLFQNLSEDKKVAIKEKMSKMSQERQKAIETVGKQIKEYRLKNTKQINYEARISRLEDLQEFALKENAPETAKRFAKIISLYEEIQAHRTLEDTSLRVE